jgi:nuclear transport factor 2 (NTF2) superfamily protein
MPESRRSPARQRSRRSTPPSTPGRRATCSVWRKGIRSTANGATRRKSSRAETISSRFLTRKWQRELEYRLIKELCAFTENRTAPRFAYEYRDDSVNWFGAYGNENWEYDEFGLNRRRRATMNAMDCAFERRLHRKRSIFRALHRYRLQALRAEPVRLERLRRGASSHRAVAAAQGLDIVGKRVGVTGPGASGAPVGTVRRGFGASYPRAAVIERSGGQGAVLLSTMRE